MHVGSSCIQYYNKITLFTYVHEMETITIRKHFLWATNITHTLPYCLLIVATKLLTQNGMGRGGNGM